MGIRNQSGRLIRTPFKASHFVCSKSLANKAEASSSTVSLLGESREFCSSKPSRVVPRRLRLPHHLNSQSRDRRARPNRQAVNSKGRSQVSHSRSVSSAALPPGSGGNSTASEAELTLLRTGTVREMLFGVAADGFAAKWSTPVNFGIAVPPKVTQGQNSTCDRTPTIAWNALPRAAVYEVFVSNLSTGATTLHAKNITSTQSTTPTLTDGSYRWWAIGVTVQGFRSLWTAPMDIFVGGRPSFLTPTGTTTDTTPTFSWKPVDGVVQYDLWVDRLGGATQVVRQQLLTTTSFTPVTALPAGNYRA